jgi:hypothetical protein
VAIIIIIALIQRSDWNEDNYLIVADENGNLSSKSESYFKNKEQSVVERIDQVRRNNEELSRRGNTRWDEITGVTDTLRARISALESRPSGGISENQQITLKALPTEPGQTMKFVVNMV